MRIGRILKAALALFIAAMLSIAGLLVLLLIEHASSVTLPAPTGAFAVARRMEVWTDAGRPDPFAGTPQVGTALPVWIWSPSMPSSDRPVVEYLPADWSQALARYQGPLLSTFLARDPARVHPHSLTAGALPADPLRFPVVILRAGLGALTTDYTTLAEDLASHGYVVVGFDAPYRTVVAVLGDGRAVLRPADLNPETLAGDAQRQLATTLMTAWVRDIQFVVDRLARLNAAPAGPFSGRLDLTHLAVIGHSLGGAEAAQFCHDDERCAAGIDLDGLLLGSVVHDGLRRPFMFLLSDHGEAQTAEDRRVLGDIQSVYDRLPSDGRMNLTIRGANHFSFSDEVLVRPGVVIALMRAAGAIKLEPRHGLAIIRESVRRFLDVHLKGAPMDSLQTLLTTYPELKADSTVH
jgi:dienelactone hydrolase